MERTDNSGIRCVQATRVLNLHEAADGWHVLKVSVGPNDDPILLLSKAEFVHGVPNSSQPRIPCRIVHVTADGKRVIDLPPPEQHPNFRHVQPLDIHSWLVVDPQAEDKHTRNARVYGHNGLLLRSFYAGDGILHALATSRGNVWIAYCDEGVFNYEDEYGPSGMVCLNDDGIPSFRFNDSIDQSSALQGSGNTHAMLISDCYALNVHSEDVAWACYYTEFPLARIKNGEVDRFYRDVPVQGSYAFATLGDTFLFAGSYDEPEMLLRFSLQDMDVQRFSPVDDSGERIVFNRFASVGRGSRLYLVTDEVLYMVDLGDVEA